MEKIINDYYENRAKKLHKIVDKILLKYGGISDKDKDDFYSLANEVFALSIRDFDQSKCSFDGFLYSNLVKKIITEIRDRNRGKRSNTKPKRDDNGNVVTDDDGKIIYEFVPDISINAPLDEDGEVTIGDALVYNFDIDKEVNTEDMEKYSGKMIKYLEKLSSMQKKILNLITYGYTPSEIIEELHINYKEYTDSVASIRSYRNISVLI